MKKYKILINLFLLALIASSCEDYLEIPAEVEISEQEIFSTYENFQGFQDKLLNNLVDYNNHGWNVTNSIGGECLAINGASVYEGNRGNYPWLITGNGHSIWSAGQISFDAGLYLSMWENIRLANLCLEKVESGILTNATDEQRNWIKGQALFFRAYYYYEYVRAFGPVPYIDMVLNSAEQDMKRHWTYEKNGKTYNDVQAVFERIVEDMEAAAALLPSRWPSPNINWGRPSKLAALGFKAKALQFSASPLFNEQANGVLDYDKELLDRCALACQETIDLAKSLVSGQVIDNPESMPEGMEAMPAVSPDGLTTWSHMRTVFARFDGIQPGTDEVLFGRRIGSFGNALTWFFHARNYAIVQLNRQRGAVASQNYLDKFEMKDGSRYKLEYDTDLDQAWENRDARYDFNFYMNADQVDQVKLNFNRNVIARQAQKNSNAIRKFHTDNLTRQNPGQHSYVTPLLRLGDIYLTYAEAVYESTGSYTIVPAGLDMSAEEALNKIRLRAGQPDVATTLPFYENNALPNTEELASDSAFRLLYRNERAIELSFEGTYWFDIRRWKRAHLKDGNELQALLFTTSGADRNVNIPSITRETVETYVFKDQHYWLPFEPSLTRFSSDWEQNPGW